MENKKVRFNVYGVILVREKSVIYEGVEKFISKPEDIADIARHYLDGVDREHFITILLDTKNKVIGISTVHIGSLNASVSHPREVFKTAILSNASNIVLVHNHPSGDPTPSHEDINMTNQFVKAGEVLGIEVLDHVIIGDGADNYYSLKREGDM